ncbi:MAG: transcription-repair coupling factor [Chloroflexi bacterium]|nr:transcription-repair coupling factor [Chloroflexota bacterium]
MSLNVLGGILESAPQFQRLLQAVTRPRASARAQILSNATPFALATLREASGVPMLIVTPRPEDARRLYEQLVLWSGDENAVLHFPEAEILPFERLTSDVDTIHQRLNVLARLTHTSPPVPLSARGEGESQADVVGELRRGEVIVASASAIAQKTIDRRAFESSAHELRRGETIDLDDLLGQWRRMGYQFEAAVYGPGFASRRGGIIDIWPVGAALPARIELWGNEVEGIRLFDPSTQRSTGMVDSVAVIPARETLPALTDREQLDRMMAYIDLSNCDEATRERLREEFGLLLDGYDVEELDFYAGFFNRGSLLDYFPKDGLLVTYRPSEVAEAALELQERAAELRRVKERRGELPLRFPSSHLDWKEVEAQASAIARKLDITPWGAEELTLDETIALPLSSPPAFLGDIDSFVGEARALASEGSRIVAVTSHSKRLAEILADYGLGAALAESLEETPAPGSITVLQAEGAGLREGFVLNADGKRLAVFGDSEIFGVSKQRRVTRRSITARREAFLAEISPGDYVVHVEHGIGRFMGVGQAPRSEGGAEHLIIQYAQGDKLYVPLEHLDRVAPYIAPLDHPPSLTRLGTQEWRRAKERAMRSTREMAAELLSLYASRELAEGHAFGPDSRWQQELEESFPFEETPDQLATIAEVKEDMEAKKPMDRLVCGDVGYGKTEIALRAAFKAVMDGKQVAVLVPTTVLAQQHYVTFSQRLSAYPTRIEVLSRFRTDAEQRAIIEGLASGQVDICIGTHRLIQNDVRFKDLGLVIIDEEQRFGVAHKERLKQMRSEVDILTLTATPIPRTLHMSLAGVRDMSTMETPPEERLPIKTYVSEFSDELIREAILRELDRQGQVYFLHNRVYNIDYMANYVKMLVPEAEVGIAHGQMPEHELEQAMLDFAEHKFDVLVCTTIIESGLDIQNVNTLIVNRADTFGLAQLYQLRGRVGRSARRAYAYLLIPRARSLTEPAEKRLKAMLAATELGAGFRIAMKDLEIRGAGNILGAEQSGHIHAVGFDLYTRLLSNAVEELRAQREGVRSQASGISQGISLTPDTLDLIPREEATVDLKIPASLPDDYITDLTLRLGAYQRLVKLTDPAEVDEMEDELRDRFGPLPWQAQNLLYIVRLKMRAQRAGVESITLEGDKIVLRLKDEIGGARRALQRAMRAPVEIGNTQIRLLTENLRDGWEAPLMDTVTRLGEFREKTTAAVLAGDRKG